MRNGRKPLKHRYKAERFCKKVQERRDEVERSCRSFEQEKSFEERSPRALEAERGFQGNEEDLRQEGSQTLKPEASGIGGQPVQDVSSIKRE